MWRLIILSVLQSLLLTGGQVFLKFALGRMTPFGWTRSFWMDSILLNWQFAFCGLCFGSGSLLWMYILKHYPLSMAYPLVSLSYVFGMISALCFFHEAVPLTRWIGVALIMIGCYFIVK